jgi:hypothetical protein
MELVVSKREKLFSLEIAALLLALISVIAGALWYAYPRHIYHSIGNVADFPPSQEPYRIQINDGAHAWVVNTGSELIIFEEHVPRPSGCAYLWVPMNHNFEDPCIGAHFSLTGELIYGPAMRDLDRYVYRINDYKIEMQTDQPPIIKGEAPP